MTLKDIQKLIGTEPDGVFGPKTAAALSAAKFDVVLDAGHTADRAREWPGAWPAGTWDTPAGRRISHALGFSASTQDSVEHLLNLHIAAFVARDLEQAGLKVLLFDDASMSNNAEFQLAAKIANAAAPKAFLSIHSNACFGVATFTTNKPCGSISYYRAGHAPSMKLAEACTAELQRVRAAAGAPGNRADSITPGSVFHVLNATPAAGAGVLCEVGFYDHAADLEFMSTHLPELGKALAKAITLTVTIDQ